MPGNFMRVPSGIDRQLHEGAHCTVHTSRECQAQAGLPGSFMLIICEDEGGGIQTPPPSPPPHLIVTEITQQLLPIPSYSLAKKRCVSA